MATVLEELVTVLGFEIDDSELDEYRKSLSDIESTLKKVALAGFAAAAGVSAYVGLVASAVDRQFKFSQSAGTVFGDIQRIGHAAQIAGASVGDVEAAFGRLNALSSQLQRGQIPEAFAYLGLSGTDAKGNIKTARQLFDDIADSISNLGTAQEQADFAAALGFSPEMVLLLRMGNKEIRQLGLELDSVGAILTDEQGRTAEKFMDSMLRARSVIRGIGNDIAIFLMPRLGQAADNVFKWAQANRELIQSGIDKWLARVILVIRPLMIFFGLLALVIGFVTIAMIGLPAVIAIVAAAALAVLAFWISEVWGYFHGEDSIISRIGKAWNTLWTETIPNAAIDGLEAFRAQLAKAKEWIVDFFPSFDFGGGLALAGGGALSPRPPSFAGASSLAGGSSTVNQENHFNIRSTDPGAVGREVSRVQDDNLRKASSALRSPVAN